MFHKTTFALEVHELTTNKLLKKLPENLWYRKNTLHIYLPNFFPPKTRGQGAKYYWEKPGVKRGRKKMQGKEGQKGKNDNVGEKKKG